MPNNKSLHFPIRPIVMRNPDALGDPHPLSRAYVPERSIASYTVKDGDSWETVARMYGLSARTLIAHNFMTTEQDYVNFYLKHITGCNQTYDDINWAFSGSATPGKVYIPPPRDERDPYIRYGEIIPRIKNPSAKDRLEKVLNVLKVVGVQGYRRLWYYEPGVVEHFLGWNTKPQVQKSMTIFTNGEVPFDGIADSRDWRVYPFQEIFEMWALRYDLSPTDAELEGQLVAYDSQILKSWMNVQTARNGGSWGPLASDFIYHVTNVLKKSPHHLYSAYSAYYHW
jgi:LysM domain-containing protein